MTTCTGVCIDPRTSVANCGGCGQACSTQNGTPSCAASTCSMSSCTGNFLDCSTNENTSRDGCETNGDNDSANCGRCGNVCSSRVCRGHTCLVTTDYGNTGAGSSSVQFTANFLAGIQIFIPPSKSVVTGLGVVLAGGSNSPKMYLGLYQDEAGKPGNLVATVTAPTVVNPGGKEFIVDPPVDISGPATFWILGVWDMNALFASISTTPVTWSYTARPYTDGSLPLTAPVGMNQDSTHIAAPNLYVIVAQ